MRTFLTSVAAFGLFSGSVLAADLPVPPVEVVVPVFTWTGFYVGAAGGYAWGNVEINPDGDGDSDFDADGWVIGPFLGYRYQWQSVVFGIEGDIEWTSIDGDEGTPLGDISTDLDWQGSLRGSVGYAFDRALIYGTGGFALAGFSSDSPAGDDDSTEWGWTLGAGLDYAFTNHVFVRGEYRYAYFSDFDNDDSAGEVQDFDSHTVRFGVGYKF